MFFVESKLILIDFTAIWVFPKIGVGPPNHPF